MSGKLLLSANPTYPRLHWTTGTYVNPMEAPMFCMLLRKYCEGGVIEAIRQIGRERIIHIDIRHRDELGDLSLKRIMIEIMGRHSNIILWIRLRVSSMTASIMSRHPSAASASSCRARYIQLRLNSTKQIRLLCKAKQSSLKRFKRLTNMSSLSQKQ